METIATVETTEAESVPVILDQKANNQELPPALPGEDAEFKALSTQPPPNPAHATEIASKDAPLVTTNNLNVGAIELTGEQQKRINLLNEYEENTREPRENRNAAIDDHDAAWRERWLGLQGEIDQARAIRGEQLLKDGTPAEHHAAILAKESADLIERFEAEKSASVQKLESTLPKPGKWLDFLKDKAQQSPDDLTLSSLIEEAEKSPDAGLEGLGGLPTKAITLSDLVHSIDKDGTLNYKRGLSTVIRDTGSRLDVKRLDNRDIEAALKISAQKFDMTKGLMLTGDIAFKVKAAEIAGKLGLPLQNSEPEVLMAWKRGHDQNPELRHAVVPSIDRGITGDLLVPKPLMELHGVVQLRADSRTIEHAEALGVVPNGDGVINLTSERLLAANAVIRETPKETLRQLVHADLSKPDGGLDAEAKAALAKENLLDANGNLTQSAKDAVIVRDDKVIIKRESMAPQLLEANPGAYRTSGENVREAESLQEFERAQQSDLQYETDQKALRVRNVDENLEKTSEHKEKAEEHKIEIEAKEILRPSRSRTQDLGMGM